MKSLLPLLLLALTARAQIPSSTAANGAAVAGLSMSQTEFVNRRYALGARLTAGIQACGPNGQEITSGWETVLEQYWVKGTAGGTASVNTQSGLFANGVFTARVAGLYWLGCAGRCDRQACDVTMRINSATRIAAFGTDLVEKRENRAGRSDGPTNTYWSSHGVSTLRYLNAGDTVSLWMESGQSNDCLYESGWFYNEFSVLLIFSGIPTTNLAN